MPLQPQFYPSPGVDIVKHISPTYLIQSIKILCIFTFPITAAPSKAMVTVESREGENLNIFHVYFQLTHICECELEIIEEITMYLTRR